MGGAAPSYTKRDTYIRGAGPSEVGPAARAGGMLLRMLGRVRSLPLFWQVFGTNALVLTLAVLSLIFAPVTVSVPVAFSELLVLIVGLVVLLVLNLALLRPAFRSFDELAETMRR